MQQSSLVLVPAPAAFTALNSFLNVTRLAQDLTFSCLVKDGVPVFIEPPATQAKAPATGFHVVEVKRVPVVSTAGALSTEKKPEFPPPLSPALRHVCLHVFVGISHTTILTQETSRARLLW